MEKFIKVYLRAKPVALIGIIDDKNIDFFFFSSFPFDILIKSVARHFGKYFLFGTKS